MAYLRRHEFDISKCDLYVLRDKSNIFYLGMYDNNLTLSGSPKHLIDTTVLALEIKFEVTNRE
jgi:hypothetical protein